MSNYTLGACRPYCALFILLLGLAPCIQQKLSTDRSCNMCKVNIANAQHLQAFLKDLKKKKEVGLLCGL